MPQPTSSSSSSGVEAKEPPTSKMPSVGGGSFGKASISSGFSVRSGSSGGGGERDSHIDSILKTIAKDSAATTHSLDYSVNDANSIRLAINKTSELDSSAGPLKKMSEKPNNQTTSKLSNAPLSPSLIKCNILKGRVAGRVAVQSTDIHTSHSFLQLDRTRTDRCRPS